jgi:hypothetical protein
MSSIRPLDARTGMSKEYLTVLWVLPGGRAFVSEVESNGNSSPRVTRLEGRVNLLDQLA